MIDKLLSALLLPAFFMVFFTRITYRKSISFLLTLALIIVSAHKGYLHTWWLITIEAFSLTVGLLLADLLFKRNQQQND